MGDPTPPSAEDAFFLPANLDSGRAANATLFPIKPAPKSSSSPIGPGSIKLNSRRVGTIFLLVPPTVTLLSGDELRVAKENVLLLALRPPVLALEEDRRRVLPVLEEARFLLCDLDLERERRRDCPFFFARR